MKNWCNFGKTICVLFFLVNITTLCVQSETIYYTLDHVILDDGSRMTGFFSWVYTPGDFENGAGQFLSLDIPWTGYDQDDLNVTFDIGSSIEITLTNNLHDDGVDITLFLTNAPTATTSAAVDLVRSKYEIGGNGFHTGVFLSGTVSPTDILLNLTDVSLDQITLAWTPDVPGLVLQQNPTLLSTNWVDSMSGSTNPALISITDLTMFYRLVTP